MQASHWQGNAQMITVVVKIKVKTAHIVQGCRCMIACCTDKKHTFSTVPAGNASFTLQGNAQIITAVVKIKIKVKTTLIVQGCRCMTACCTAKKHTFILQSCQLVKQALHSQGDAQMITAVVKIKVKTLLNAQGGRCITLQAAL